MPRKAQLLDFLNVQLRKTRLLRGVLGFLKHNDKDVLQEELCSFLPFDEAWLGDDDELYEYDTDGPGDVETLKEVVALAHDRSSETYKDQCELIKKSQLSYEKRAEEEHGYTGKVHVTILVTKGRAGFSMYHGW